MLTAMGPRVGLSGQNLQHTHLRAVLCPVSGGIPGCVAPRLTRACRARRRSPSLVADGGTVEQMHYDGDWDRRYAVVCLCPMLSTAVHMHLRRSTCSSLATSLSTASALLFCEASVHFTVQGLGKALREQPHRV